MHPMRGRLDRSMSRAVQVTLDAHDPRGLCSFWRDVLGYVHPAPPGAESADGADPRAVWDEVLAAQRVERAPTPWAFSTRCKADSEVLGDRRCWCPRCSRSVEDAIVDPPQAGEVLVGSFALAPEVVEVVRRREGGGWTAASALVGLRPLPRGVCGTRVPKRVDEATVLGLRVRYHMPTVLAPRTERARSTKRYARGC